MFFNKKLITNFGKTILAWGIFDISIVAFSFISGYIVSIFVQSMNSQPIENSLTSMFSNLDRYELFTIFIVLTLIAAVLYPLEINDLEND